MPYLVIHTPNMPPQRIALREPVILGRGAGCEIWIEDTQVSRNHCRFEPRDNDWWVVDLESRNGTFIDGARIGEALLSDNSTILVGASEIVFHPERISDRPADPIEAAEMTGSILDRESASENSTILGQTLNGVTAQEQNDTRTVDHERAVSLPFKRQPPKPIVYHNDADE